MIEMDEFREKMNKIKDLAAVGTSNSISSLISGVFWIFMASLLGTEGYGQFSYFIAIASIASIIAFLGIGNTIIVYTAKKEKFQSELYSLAIFSGIVASGILFVIFQNIGISVFVIGTIVFGIIASETLGLKNYQKYGKILIIQRIMQVGLCISLFYISGIDGLILGYGISYLPFIVLFYKKLSFRIDFRIIKKYFSFMMDSYSLNVSRRLSLSLDKLIIAPLFGFMLLGNYQLSVQIFVLMSILPQSVFQYMLPQDATGKKSKKLKTYTILLSIIFTIIGIFAAPVLLPILFPDFEESIELVQIMSIGIIPLTVSLMYTSKFLGNENSRPILYSSIIFIIIQIGLILILGEFYGITGIAIATVLAYTGRSIYLIIADKTTKD